MFLIIQQTTSFGEDSLLPTLVSCWVTSAKIAPTPMAGVCFQQEDSKNLCKDNTPLSDLQEK